MTQWQLRRRYRLLFRGVYVHDQVGVTTHVLATAALLVAAADSYVSHHTAAVLWGGVVPDDPDIHVTSPGTRCKTVGIVGHRAKREQAVTVRRGVRLTTPIQTFLDLAQVLNLVDLVVLGDSFVKKQRCTPEQLIEQAALASGPGASLARRAAALVRRGVDSPMESRLRMLIVLGGLPEPKVGHRIYARDGSLLYRFDLAYLGHGLVIEYDGRQHADDPAQWEADVRRDEQLDNWRVRRVVVLSKDIYNTPANTLSRIITAMRDKGMTVPPLSNEWRRYFPSKPWDLAEPA
ncbi:MAG TPA: hypothetical protein VFM07_02625 [Intrasporangium sp.]|nr:hypothetical protein [Intrasporangium sp.]